MNDIFEQLENESSTLKKIEILKSNTNNKTLKLVISKALNPFEQFFQRKIPKYKPNTLPVSKLEDTIHKLDALINREITGNAAIDYLTNLLNHSSKDDALVIERIIKKDLGCGVAAATVNKVWPGLIFEYPCMLASPMNERTIKHIVYPAYAQVKMDGMRFNAVIQKSKISFFSRNGKPMVLNGILDDQFPSEDGVYDGELLCISSGSVNPLDRQTGNGILSKSIKGTMSIAESKLVHAVVWDFIPIDDFIVNRVCKIPYSKRYEMLSSAKLGKRVSVIENHVVNSLEEANEVYQMYLSQGQEGIVLKSKDGIWEDKRVNYQIKFKAELDCDLRVVDWGYGTNRMKDILGYIECETEDHKLKVDVGSGFSEEQRKLYSKEPLNGKIVTVKYNAVITNKKGETTLFLPIFVEVRSDKSKANTLKEIL